MHSLFAAMLQDKSLQRLQECFCGGASETLAYGLGGSQKHAAVAACYEAGPQPTVIILHSRESLEEWREDLSLLPSEDCRVCLIALRGAAADAVFADCRVNGGLFFERGGIAAERMLHLLSTGSDRQIPAKEASEYAYQLLMALSGSGSPGPAGRRKLPPVVEAALGILRRDYAFLEGIGELAERLEVSQEYLTRCFVKYMGVTPGKYLNQVRIENAMLLLRQGRHSVQFVSDACGFSNGNYFARVFRSAVGMNPREYARLQHALPPEAQDREDSLYVL